MAKNKILSSVAVTAVGAAAFSGAAVAQTSENPFVLSFEGAVGSGNYSNAYGQEKLGASGFDEYEDDVAFVGSVGLSRSINEDWDWSLSLSQRNYSDNSASTIAGPYAASLPSSARRSEVAFSLGHHVDAGPAKARLGLGLAYAQASADKGIDLAAAGGSFNGDASTNFQGVGPRLSLDLQSAPVSPNGKLSLIGGVEASVLVGQYGHSKGIEVYGDDTIFGGDGSFEISESDQGDLVTAGLFVGVQYDANENTSFRAGVRRDVTRMDRVSVESSDSFSVQDTQDSFFVGMKVGF